jgi:hypothetical protein
MTALMRCCVCLVLLCSDAHLQDELARQTSTATRQLLQLHHSNPAAGRLPSLAEASNGPCPLPHNAAHLLMPQGGAIATLRLAQPLLIGFCTKLDWGGR